MAGRRARGATYADTVNAADSLGRRPVTQVSNALPLAARTAARYDKRPKPGEVAEWSKAAVLKTVEGQPSVGSNPTLSAIILHNLYPRFLVQEVSG